MNLTAISLWLHKSKAVCDGLFAVASLIAVPAVCTVPIVWYFQGSGTVHSSGASSYKMRSGQPAEISSELQFTEKPLRVFYHMELVDALNRVAYRYPEVMTKGIPQFDNVVLQVPQSLQPGDYSLVARVKYAVNPIKSSNTTVQVAAITVN